MPDLRTTVTELVTGLGMLGYERAEDALGARPAEMVSVSPETWTLLERARSGGALAGAFDEAWENGRAFLEAEAALRGRRPAVVEWKGSHRAPGTEVAPIDLRVDHVYLVSCKYLSSITMNASPAHLVDRLLEGGHGVRGGDWFAEVAPAEYLELYRAVVAELGLADAPAGPTACRPELRRRLASLLRPRWPGTSGERYAALAEAVARETARRWQVRLANLAASEQLLWRLLRIGSAPYFVLGASRAGPLRLRVATPWDWRVDFRLRDFSCEAQPGGQPRVGWRATVEDRHLGKARVVEGHVEIRWSHGRFGGNPEAKCYLDTAHRDVPGYYALGGTEDSHGRSADGDGARRATGSPAAFTAPRLPLGLGDAGTAVRGEG